MALCLLGLSWLMSPCGFLSSPRTPHYFGVTPGGTAIACELSQTKTSGSQFLSYKTRMTNTSQPHKGVERNILQPWEP